MDRTLVIISPSAVQRELYGEVFARIVRQGFKVVGAKFTLITEEQAKKYHFEHDGKPFFPGLVEYMCSAPVLLVVLEGDTNRVRQVAGSPGELVPGTIMGDYSQERGRRAVLSSMDEFEADRQIRIFFEEHELVKWSRATEAWITEIIE